MLIYFTNWGVILTWLSFVFFIAAHLQTYFLTGSPCVTEYNQLVVVTLNTNLWKWAKVSYEAAIVSEVVIVVVYWTLIYGTYEYPDPSFFLIDIASHALPLALLLIEFFINAIKIPRNHYVLMFVFIGVYNIVNYAATKIMGVPVYAI